MAFSRRKGTDRIDDPKKRAVTFLKRSHGLVKKASILNSLTGARVALIVLPPEGEPYSFGKPSVGEVFSEYICRKGDVKLPMSSKEWLDWAEKNSDSCVTKEDCASLIMKDQVVLNCLRKKSKDLESNPAVNAAAGDDSGVGAGPNPRVSKDDGINLLVRDLEASHPSLSPFRKDNVDRFAADGGSSEMDSDPECSDLKGCGLDLDGLLNRPEDNGLWTWWQQNSSVGCASSGEESLHLRSLGL